MLTVLGEEPFNSLSWMEYVLKNLNPKSAYSIEKNLQKNVTNFLKLPWILYIKVVLGNLIKGKNVLFRTTKKSNNYQKS